MSIVQEIAGVRDQDGRSITLTEGASSIQMDAGTRHLNAPQCRKLAAQLLRAARRLEDRTTS